MSVELKKPLQDVDEHRAANRAPMDEERSRYITSTVENIFEDEDLFHAVVARWVQSDLFIEKLVRSEAFRRKLVQTDAFIQAVARSPEALRKLVQFEEGLVAVARAVKKNPAARAKLIALLNEPEPEASS